MPTEIKQLLGETKWPPSYGQWKGSEKCLSRSRNRRSEVGSATGSSAKISARRPSGRGLKRQLTLHTCPHQPGSEEERYRQCHLGPHLSRFHCASRVPFSSDARERNSASEPVVTRRKRGGGHVCEEGIVVERKRAREGKGRAGMRGRKKDGWSLVMECHRIIAV